MAFTIKDYSPDDLTDILAGTQGILNTAWELSLFPKDVAELVAFLVHTLREEPKLVTEAFIANIAKYWTLGVVDVEVAVLDVLAMHGEDAGDTIIYDLNTLSVIFSHG